MVLKGKIVFFLLLFIFTSFLYPKKRIRYSLLRGVAFFYLKKGDTDGALPYFRKMAELQPYNESALYNYALALLYKKKGSYKKYRVGLKSSVSLLQKCIKMQLAYQEKSELGLRYYYLGMAYWLSGEPLLAKSAFAKSYAADFERTDSLYNIFSIQEELGDYKGAEIARRKFLSVMKKNRIDD